MLNYINNELKCSGVEANTPADPIGLALLQEMYPHFSFDDHSKENAVLTS